MNRQDGVMELFEKHNAVVRNTHVVFTSSKHGDTYINKDALYPDTRAVASLCQLFADHFASRGIEIVAAPAIGGVALAQWTAHQLSNMGQSVLAVYAEKQADGHFQFRRGYDALLKGRHVLVVEDIVTTGGSVKGVIEAARQCGAHIEGVAVICNRGGVQPGAIGDPPEVFSLVNINLNSWSEDDCPLCARSVPVNPNLVKGHEYLARKK